MNPVEIYVQSYENGMNRDMNTESVQGQYFDCENFRIFVNGENTVGGLSTIPGTKFIFDLDSLTNRIGTRIIAVCNIRDLVVLFTTDNTTPQGGTGFIFTFSVDKVTHQLKTPLTLVYVNPDLKFSTKKPIEAHGHYENEDKQFAYFSDHVEETRCINIATVQLSDPIESIGLFINTSLPQPRITDIEEGGALPVGIYEIAAYFNTVNGKKSLYTPNSNQVHIVTSKELENSNINYTGDFSIDTLGDTIFTNKSIRASIDLSTIPAGLFKSVTFISIFKSNITQTPVISEIETIQLGTLNAVEFLYTNLENSSFYIPYEEYLINQHPFYTNKTFSILKTQLSVSNIKGKSYDLEWDTRTVRWNHQSLPIQNNFEATGDIYNNPFNDESGKRNGLFPTGTPTTWHQQDQFLYQSDQLTVGGESLDGSIKYRFTLENIKGDESNDFQLAAVNNSGPATYNISGNTFTNPYFQTYDSPLMRELRQYKRGEVYRFGLIGVKRGKTSFVKIIGDIKFPEVSTIGTNQIFGDFLTTSFNHFATATLQGSTTYLHPLGIEFTINIPPTVDVDYIQIVRVPRTQRDKTRLCQGVINKFYNKEDSGGTAMGEYISMSDINDIENYFASGAYSTQSLSGPVTFQWANRQIKQSSKEILNFYTPEASFQYLYPDRIEGDYLKVVGILDRTQKNNRTLGATDNPASAWTPGGAPGEGWGGSLLRLVGSNFVPLNGNSGQRRLMHTKARNVSPVPKYTEEFHRELLRDVKFSVGFYGDDNLQVNFSDNIRLRNYSFEHSNLQGFSQSNPQGAYGGSCLLLRLVSPIANDPFESSPPTYGTFTPNTASAPWQSWRYKAFLIDYTRNLSEQYGGINPNSFEFNEFIPVSNPIYTSGVYKIYNGDTFITMFNFMKNYWDNSQDNESFYESVVFPVETHINTDLNIGKTFVEGTGGFNHTGTPEIYRSQETGNLKGNMFVYNRIFTENRLDRPEFSKPVNFQENLHYDVRTYLSLNKQIGEELNSFCRFPVNSFLDVKSEYGPINRTHFIFNQLLYLQDYAVGYISVNPRAVVGTTDGIPTELGTAEGMQDFNYLSNTAGCIHQWGSLAIDNTLYFYDGINRKFRMLSGNNPADLSELLGMDSYFRSFDGPVLYTRDENGDNPIEYKGVILAFDRENKEIYITSHGNYSSITITRDTNEVFTPGTIINYLGTLYEIIFDFNPSDYSKINIIVFNMFIFPAFTKEFDPTKYSKTLVFSNNKRFFNFRSFYSFAPFLYIDDGNFLMSPNGTEIYLHNYGKPADIYGVKYPSSLTFVFNEKGVVNKLLQWVDYSLTLKAPNGLYINNVGLDNIRLFNDYQDTGVVSLQGRQKQRFRRWSVKLPRDQNSLNSLARMRGDWTKIMLSYNNLTDDQLNLERIGVVYKPQIN
jgi:hypothetical protein